MRGATQEARPPSHTEAWMAEMWSRASSDCGMHVKKSALRRSQS